ncbi:hypothetical protein JX580_00255 [Thiomicrospira microaerophila]|uniref:hypothetical protein n=1 Tax=Thiomicrospira microaerophila TaxID=406020 RepID=UPI00200EED39|nr:hypothetical protein [Thiomicrospira microaerophila]UQB42383.1 hypothetical protein JX580_00255 [Thiomicrospira microaerophila]
MNIRPVYWVIFIAVALFFGLMALAPKDQGFNSAHLPWNAAYDEQNRLQALGITLNESTLKDLIELYGRDIEVKLFQMPDGGRSAEAYIHSAYIGSIHGSLVIKLSMTDAELDRYYDRGARTTVSKQGAREVQLNNEDTLALFNYPIGEITLVPRRRLTDLAIEKRFGEPSRIVENEDLTKSLFFDQMGLELILIEKGNDILRYTHHPAS